MADNSTAFVQWVTQHEKVKNGRKIAKPINFISALKLVDDKTRKIIATVLLSDASGQLGVLIRIVKE